MANPKKPAQLHKLEGTYRHHRHEQRGVEPRSAQSLADLPIPYFLSIKEKRLWSEILRRAPKGVLQAADRELMIAYVGNARVVEETIIAQHGRPLVDDDGRPSPYLRLLRQHSETLRGLASRLGFDPVARTGLGVPADAGKSDEPTTNLHLRRLRLVEPNEKIQPGRR